MSKKNKKRDTSPKIPQNDKLKDCIKINDRELTPKQVELLKTLRDKDTKMVFISGPAGTSKTFTSVLAGLHLINEKRVSEIIYVRSAVESSDSKLGFLPGEMDDKLSPYVQPLIDKLEELSPYKTKDYFFEAMLGDKRIHRNFIFEKIFIIYKTH